MKCRNLISLIVATAYLILSLPANSFCGNRGNQVIVPADSVFRLELLSQVSTETNKKGDEFTCKVLEPSRFANSYVSGRITKLKSSGKASGKSEIALAFDLITLPNGQTGQFSAQITDVYDVEAMADNGKAREDGTVRARSLRKRDTVTIVGATALGIIVGALFGGVKGAAIGGAIAAGLAVTNTLATKGPDMKFDAGTQFDVRTRERSNKKQ